MHLAEGIVPLPVLGVGAVLAAGGVAVGLRNLDDRRIVPAAVVASGLFVASLIHIPIGPASAHLVLNGLAGLILGWAVFPAFLVALLLQAIFFGHGGLSTLGLNTLNLALPAVLCYGLFSAGLRNASPKRAVLFGFMAGFLSVALACVLLCLSLWTAGRGLLALGQGLVVLQVPLMIVEGLVTAAAVTFLRKVRPETFALWIPPSLELDHEHT